MGRNPADTYNLFSGIFDLARSCQKSKAPAADDQTGNHQRHDQADRQKKTPIRVEPSVLAMKP